ncbi:unnamed protein product [Sphagnum troendelagicum]|uniref:Uncharacterized protein n=1 Tax=Sphagnum troendelagicum TaxID=128251 RepID=A0ABP0UYW4_9BRYO
MHLVAGNGAWELADFQPSLSILIPVTLLTLSPRQQRQELLLRSRMKMTSKMRGPPWTKTERTRSAQKTRMDPLTENDRIRSTNECGKLSLEQPANQQPRAEVRTAVLLTATTTETRRICGLLNGVSNGQLDRRRLPTDDDDTTSIGSKERRARHSRQVLSSNSVLPTSPTTTSFGTSVARRKRFQR